MSHTIDTTKLKSVYVPLAKAINAQLASDPQSSLATALPMIERMASRLTGTGSRSASKIIKHSATGLPFAVFCAYHEKWERLDKAPYKVRSTTSTGFGPTCLEAAQSIREQRLTAAKSEAAILPSLTKGEIEATDIPELQREIAQAQAQTIPRQDGHGLTREQAEAEMNTPS